MVPRKKSARQRQRSEEVNAGETGQDPVRVIALQDIRPSPENEKLYKPVRANDPATLELVASIRQHGLLDPIVITSDGWIVSGHRRHMAAGLAGLTHVLCRVLPIRREDNPDEFTRLLREYNRQRIKTRLELTREAIIDADPDEAYRALIEHRQKREQSGQPGGIKIKGEMTRARISDNKMPMLDSIRQAVAEQRKFWPLSDRQIHYLLLNDPPLRHAKKPGSRYGNNQASYKNLTNLLTRARLEGLIDMQAIDDVTRQVIEWRTWADPGSFVREEADDFLKGYRRDYQQSQTDHLEIIVEKNTLVQIVRPVAMQYLLPLTTGRGFISLPPRQRIADRFEMSGKDRLVLIVVSDFDPEGESICHSLAYSMRDDFGIEDVVLHKAAITPEQIRQFRLPAQFTAKRGSSRYAQFVREHGTDVYECEALSPQQLQDSLRRCVESALDLDAFNAELASEKRDAAHLAGIRGTVRDAVTECLADEEDSE